MRIGLTVDAACDLPWSFIQQNNIFVLPISFRINDRMVEDIGDPARRAEFYRAGALSKEHDVEAIPYTAEQIRQLFLDRVVVDYDFAFIQTVMGTRSPIHANAQEAMNMIVGEYRQRRQEAGVSGPFSMRVVDSGTAYAGHGVLAAETMRLIKANTPKNELRTRVAGLTAYTYGYAVAPDVYYLRERARQKGDKSVSFTAAMLAKALDIAPIVVAHNSETYPVAKVRGFEAGVQRLFEYAARRIEVGLMSPYVCVSYAGAEDEISQLPGFDRLAAAARQHGVELLTGMMGLSGGTIVGPGTVSLGLIAEPHTFE